MENENENEKPFATQQDILSEEAFLALTTMSRQKFRKLARDGGIPGAVVLGQGNYVVVMSLFVEGAAVLNGRNRS